MRCVRAASDNRRQISPLPDALSLAVLRLPTGVDDRHQPSSARNAFTSAANSLWCWKRKPWAESG
jgi:hypothetical protein